MTSLSPLPFIHFPSFSLSIRLFFTFPSTSTLSSSRPEPSLLPSSVWLLCRPSNHSVAGKREIGLWSNFYRTNKHPFSSHHVPVSPLCSPLFIPCRPRKENNCDSWAVCSIAKEISFPHNSHFPHTRVLVSEKDIITGKSEM